MGRFPLHVRCTTGRIGPNSGSGLIPRRSLRVKRVRVPRRADMALDLAVISGYVMVLLVRGAGHVADKVLDHLLDRLASLINERIDRPSLKALQNNPGEIEIERVSRKLAAAAKANRAFASQLQAVIRDLERHGGRTFINQVTAEQNVQAFDGSIAVGRDYNVNVP